MLTANNWEMNSPPDTPASPLRQGFAWWSFTELVTGGRGIAGLLRHLRFDGWVGHEFIPRGEPVAALRHAAAAFAWFQPSIERPSPISSIF